MKKEDLPRLSKDNMARFLYLPLCFVTKDGWHICGKCGHKQCFLTNADRIRAMSDEEQIKFFSMVSKAAGCPPANPMDCMDDYSQCWEVYFGNPANRTE